VFGKLARLDDRRARAVPGVRQVVPLPAPTPPAGSQPLGGVAVIADHTYAAIRGRAALDLAWDAGPNGEYDSQRYTDELLAAVRAPGETVRKVGDADRALAGAARRVEAEYIVPHLTHAPMEPPAALVKLDGDRCEVWTCTQDPQDAQEAVAKALGLPPARVTVHVTFLGGGFGRKSIPDYAVEAALLARAAGAPVRVQWTREDEIRHGYYHTHSAQALAAGLDAGGNVVASRSRRSARRSRPTRPTRASASCRRASSTCRSRSPTSSSRPAPRRSTSGSAGCARSTMSSTRSRSSRSSPSSPPRPGATRATCCSPSSAPAAT
jgi:isoquinoline 1-oxidoreductase beta subunit